MNWVLATSAVYEMLEWLVAAAVDPSLGSEFVGAQGDDFDAAKDMALAFAGAVHNGGYLPPISTITGSIFLISSSGHVM